MVIDVETIKRNRQAYVRELRTTTSPQIRNRLLDYVGRDRVAGYCAVGLYMYKILDTSCTDGTMHETLGEEKKLFTIVTIWNDDLFMPFKMIGDRLAERWGID